MDSIVPSVFTSASSRVLLLGAGFVCRPTAQILSDAGIKVTVACRGIEKAQKLAEGLSNASAISLDLNDEAALDKETASNDLVVSLVPYTYHAIVIKSAIKNKKHVVTTSYVSPAMQELNAQAKEAGITVMNEIGLDPGLDHLYAIKTIAEVHKAGGKITSFLSYCGGLPAPEASDNPLGYKFSWSSRGVLLALGNAAKFYRDDQTYEVSGKELMREAKPYYSGFTGFAFVAYPNRDSTPYRERYQIPEAKTIIRGTLRYGGFPEFIKTLVDVGFLSEEPKDFLKLDAASLTWKEAFAKIMGATSSSELDLLAAVSSKTSFKDNDEKDKIISGLKWIGLFSDTPVTFRGNPLDTLCAELEKKMQYEEGERDMVFLQHKFGIENADGSKEERFSTLVEYGDPKGYSAMAKLVGVPCAVAVQQVLNGSIKERGILAPMSEELDEPLRKELKEKYGIELIEKSVPA